MSCLLVFQKERKREREREGRGEKKENGAFKGLYVEWYLDKLKR